MTNPIHAVILDANQSWVESLFVAMSRTARVQLLRVESPPELLKRLSGRARPAPRGLETRSIAVPGLRRFTSLSQRRVSGTLRRVANAAQIDLLVCTSPWHAPAIEETPAALKIYYATDPFQYFAWPRERTRRLEDRALAASDLVVATSVQLADDLRSRVGVPVVHLPNAVSQSFLDALDRQLPRPTELASITGPTIGVIGQINDSYDWDLIDALSRELPDVTTVFVGPVMRSETQSNRFERLATRPNVLWVGPKPHASLPRYLAAFDVCLNPLRKDPRNDRRSPLRLFDYSATRAPIASTPIREAETFGDQLTVIEAPEDAATVVRALLDAPAIDVAARQAWAQRNTWEARADAWLRLVEEHLGRAP